MRTSRHAWSTSDLLLRVADTRIADAVSRGNKSPPSNDVIRQMINRRVAQIRVVGAELTIVWRDWWSVDSFGKSFEEAWTTMTGVPVKDVPVIHIFGDCDAADREPMEDDDA